MPAFRTWAIQSSGLFTSPCNCSERFAEQLRHIYFASNVSKAASISPSMALIRSVSFVLSDFSHSVNKVIKAEILALVILLHLSIEN